MANEMVVTADNIDASNAFGHLWRIPLQYDGQTGEWRGYFGGYGVVFSGTADVATDGNGQPVSFTAVLDGSFTLFTNAPSGGRLVVGTGTMPVFSYTSGLVDGDSAQRDGNGGWNLTIHGSPNAPYPPLGPFGQFVSDLDRVAYNGSAAKNVFDASYMETDTVLRGGGGDDTLFGAFRHANQIFGDDGNDNLRGQGDNDVLDGGAGDDTVYDSDNQGDGTAPVGSQAHYNHDTLLGGDGKDQILSAGGGDLLDGGAGDDYLQAGGSGRADDDTLIGGAGNDTIWGGLGTDTAVFSGTRAQYTISEVNDGTHSTYTVSGVDGVDQIHQIELLRFDDGTMSVANMNMLPAIISNGGGDTAAITVAENLTAVTAVMAVDGDAGQVLSYSISGGADAARFTIDAATGALAFVTAPDFEAPTDADTDNVYDVTVQVSDGTATDTQAIAVTVSDATKNGAPTIISNGGGASASLSLSENVTSITTVLATDPDAGQTLTYSIVSAQNGGGADAARFQIDPVSGVLSFVAAPDFEAPTDAGTDNVYDVTVQVSDGNGGLDSQAIAVTVTDVLPIVSFGVNEANNAPEGITNSIRVYRAGDTSQELTVSYQFVSNTIGEPQATPGQDFEVAQSQSVTFAAGQSEAQIRVPQYIDGVYEGPGNEWFGVALVAGAGYALGAVNVANAQIVDRQSQPVLSVANAQADEGESSVIFTATLSGPSATPITVTYTTAIGGTATPEQDFTAVSGTLTFAPGETAKQLTVAVNDDANHEPDETFLVNLSNATGATLAQAEATGTIINDDAANAAPTITSNGGGATAAVSVAENSTAVTTVLASDPDAAQTLTYSIAGGADAARFAIDAATGALAFVTAPNFEAPTDAGTDNVYDVTVQVSDGAAVDTQALAVTVTNVSEVPVLDLNGAAGGRDVTLNYTEQQAATPIAPEAVASDTDSADFSGGSLRVVQTFSAGTDRLTIGNIGTGAGQIGVSGNTVSYEGIAIGTFSGGTAGGDLVITFNGSSVTAVAVQALVRDIHYENGQGENPNGNPRTYTYVLDDGNGGTSTATATVNVERVNDPPVVTAGNTVTYTENHAATVISPAATVTDVDAVWFGGGSLTVSLSANGTPADQLTIGNIGTGVGQISISGNTVSFQGIAFGTFSGGVNGADLTINFFTNTAPTPAAVQALLRDIQFSNTSDDPSVDARIVTFTLNDGGNTGGPPNLTGSDTATINVTAVNDAPAIASNGSGDAATAFVAENTTAVTTVTATDLDSSTLTYAIVGGADAAQFQINPASGVLTFVAAPDFEKPTDAGLDNVYDVTVQVSDGSGGSDTQAIALTVTNVAGIIQTSNAATITGTNEEDKLTGGMERTGSSATPATMRWTAGRAGTRSTTALKAAQTACM